MCVQKNAYMQIFVRIYIMLVKVVVWLRVGFWVCMCMYVCVSVRICMCVYVCMYVSVCVSVCVCCWARNKTQYAISNCRRKLRITF